MRIKHTKHFKGVKLTMTGKHRIRDGHGCSVQVGQLVFKSEHTAKRFIKSLLPMNAAER